MSCALDLRFFTYQELAQVFAVHPKTVSRWVRALERNGKLSAFRPTNNTVRIPQDQVQALLAAKVKR